MLHTTASVAKKSIHFWGAFFPFWKLLLQPDPHHGVRIDRKIIAYYYNYTFVFFRALFP